MLDLNSDPLKGKKDEIDQINIFLQILYTYSQLLIQKYQDLFYKYFNNFDASLSDFKDEINQIKKIILTEHKLYSKLLNQNQQILFKIIEDLIKKQSNNPGYLRFKSKLQFNKNIACDCSISAKDLSLDTIPQDIDFDLILSVTTYIHINTIKTIHKALPEIIESLDLEDTPHLSILTKYLNSQLIYKSFGNDLFEMIAINSNMDIESLPNIGFDKIFEAFNNIYYNTALNPYEMLSDTMLNLSMEETSRIRTLKINDEKDITPTKTMFNYIYSITKLRILINHMDKKSLQTLKTYISKLNFENHNIKNAVKVLLKEKEDYFNK